MTMENNQTPIPERKSNKTCNIYRIRTSESTYAHYNRLRQERRRQRKEYSGRQKTEEDERQKTQER